MPDRVQAASEMAAVSKACSAVGAAVARLRATSSSRNARAAAPVPHTTARSIRTQLSGSCEVSELLVPNSIAQVRTRTLVLSTSMRIGRVTSIDAWTAAYVVAKGFSSARSRPRWVTPLIGVVGMTSLDGAPVRADSRSRPAVEDRSAARLHLLRPKLAVGEHGGSPRDGPVASSSLS